MEMTLSDGVLASYSCGARLWISYLTAVFFLGMFVTIVLSMWEISALRKAVGNPRSPYGWRPGNPTFLFDPKPKTISRTLVIFVAAGVLWASLIALLFPSRTRLFATETSIVETGCHILTPYREILDRKFVEFHYRYGRGKGGFDELEIAQNGKSPLGIGLRGNPYLKNLFALAPEAMDQYFAQLKAEGKALPQL